MKNILQINTVPNGSTGKIMLGIKKICNEDSLNYKCYSACSYSDNHQKLCDFSIGFPKERFLHKTLAQVTGVSEVFSVIGTAYFIHQIKKLNPDLIHLHNIHGWYLNVPILFRYIKKNKIPVVWTLHDCWSITGRCPHFLISKCEKWITGCFDCDYGKNDYPTTIVQNEKKMWRLKRDWFSNLENLTIVTPSKWLAHLVEESYLKNSTIKVLNNGIDLSIFRPQTSDFRERYLLEDKFIVLGVAFGWGYRKGLDVFIDLAKRLDDTCKIVLVGTDDKVDITLPNNIISIHKTDNQVELAKIYTAADVLVNPTREDNYPTVNMESIACGTPVITFDTGGSAEMISSSTGYVIENNDVDALYNTIVEFKNKNCISQEDCIEAAKRFDMNDKLGEYCDLYKELLL